ncbi:MAG TPA: metallophosphoesterase family protein [Microvirga sp.]|nr:metallophosphoesterase family protein [Microvirga sp.]
MSPRLPEGVRIYAIGDVHGRLDLLDALLARIDDDLRASPVDRPIEVLVGDYIDRGPDSRGVVARLVERRRKRELVCLMGNHESFLLAFLRDPAVLRQWLPNGGLATLESYGVQVRSPTGLPIQAKLIAEEFRSKLPPEHEDFLSNLPHAFSCGDYLFVHAGIRPNVPLDRQSPDDLLWIREEFLLSTAVFEKIVVHGHTPVARPEIRPNRIAIDTGAYFTGRLTCLVLEGADRRFL